MQRISLQQSFQMELIGCTCDDDNSVLIIGEKPLPQFCSISHDIKDLVPDCSDESYHTLCFKFYLVLEKKMLSLLKKDRPILSIEGTYIRGIYVPNIVIIFAERT